MAKVVIAELEIDIEALLKSTSDVKKEIDKLKEAQKELSNQGDTSSKQYIQNAADLKTLSSAYNSNIKAINESTQAQADQANQSKLVALALSTEAQTIKEARDQNTLLSRLRNETNVNTVEGKAQLDALNKKLDENNNFIKENADAYLKQKINIGNYSEGIKDALNNLNPFNGGIAGFTQRSQEAGGAGNLLKQSFSGLSQGIIGATKASLAFIATPIGAIIAAIVVVVTLLYNAFKAFTPIVDKVEQAFAGLSAVFSAVKNTVIALVTGAKSLGDAFSSLGGDMKDAYNSAVALKKAQQDLEDAMKEQELQSARNRAEINRLNIQAKDRTKSDEERLALLEKSAKLEEIDFAQRKKNSDEALRQAYEQIRIEGSLTDAEFAELKKRGLNYKEYYETKGTGADELFDKLKESLIKETEIQNEFYSNQEKNINKQNKLIEDAEAEKEKQREQAKKRQEEAESKRQKAIDDLIQKSQEEIELFKAQQGFKAKSNQEAYEFNKQLFEKESKDLELQYSKGRISKLQYETEKLNLTNEYAKANADILIAEGEREIEMIRANSKLSIDERLKAEMDFATLRLEQGLINEQQYQDEITRLQNDAQKLRDDKKLADQQAEQEKKLIDLENQRANDQLNFETEVEIQRQQNEIKLQQELANAQKSGADISLIKQKYAKMDSALVESIEAKKRMDYANTFGQLASLFGEGSKVGKAFAIGQATLSGYQAVLNAYMTAQKSPITILNPAYPFIQAGIAGAFSVAQIAKISGAKFEKGGIQEIGGKRHSAGGTKFYGEDGTMFEAEAGEGIGILNRNAFASFMDFNNSHLGGASRGGFFQGGGIITQGVKPQSLNIDAVVDAIASMPAPVVAVEEIQTVGNRYTQVVSGANL